MGKRQKVQRSTISDIFRHFGQQEQSVRKAFLNGANLKTSHMKDAASDVLPVQNTWGRIEKSANANGWKAPEKINS